MGRVEVRRVARLAPRAVAAAPRHAIAGRRLQPALPRVARAARARRVGRGLRVDRVRRPAQRGLRVGAVRRAARAPRGRRMQLFAACASTATASAFRKPVRTAKLLNTDAALYGGATTATSAPCAPTPCRMHGREHSLALTLPRAGRDHPRTVVAMPKRLESGQRLSARRDLGRHRRELRALLGERRTRRSVRLRQPRAARDRALHAARIHRRGLARLPAGTAAGRALRLPRLRTVRSGTTATASTTTSC